MHKLNYNVHDLFGVRKGVAAPARGLLKTLCPFCKQYRVINFSLQRIPHTVLPQHSCRAVRSEYYLISYRLLSTIIQMRFVKHLAILLPWADLSRRFSVAFDVRCGKETVDLLVEFRFEIFEKTNIALKKEKEYSKNGFRLLKLRAEIRSVFTNRYCLVELPENYLNWVLLSFFP